MERFERTSFQTRLEEIEVLTDLSKFNIPIELTNDFMEVVESDEEDTFTSTR